MMSAFVDDDEQNRRHRPEANKELLIQPIEIQVDESRAKVRAQLAGKLW